MTNITVGATLPATHMNSRNSQLQNFMINSLNENKDKLILLLDYLIAANSLENKKLKTDHSCIRSYLNKYFINSVKGSDLMLLATNIIKLCTPKTISSCFFNVNINNLSYPPELVKLCTTETFTLNNASLKLIILQLNGETNFSQELFDELKMLNNNDFSFINLSNCKFNGLDLSNTNFNRTNLAGTQFYTCNLNQVSFTAANLNNTRFKMIQLEGQTATKDLNKLIQLTLQMHDTINPSYQKIQILILLTLINPFINSNKPNDKAILNKREKNSAAKLLWQALLKHKYTSEDSVIINSFLKKYYKDLDGISPGI